MHIIKSLHIHTPLNFGIYTFITANISGNSKQNGVKCCAPALSVEYALANSANSKPKALKK